MNFLQFVPTDVLGVLLAYTGFTHDHMMKLVMLAKQHPQNDSHKIQMSLGSVFKSVSGASGAVRHIFETAIQNNDVLMILELHKIGDMFHEAFTQNKQVDQNRPQKLLSIASYYGHTVLLDMLLQVTPWVTLEDTNGWTALHFAAHKGHIEIVKKLLCREISYDAVDSARKIAIDAGHFGTAALLSKEVQMIGRIYRRDRPQLKINHIVLS